MPGIGIGIAPHEILQTYSLGGFSPLDIADLLLWFDASQITGVADGAGLATWEDLSGNGFDATQANAAFQPTYRAAGLNGLPEVDFNGVDEYMDLPVNFNAGTFAAVGFLVFTAPAATTGGAWQMRGIGFDLHFPFTDDIYDNFFANVRPMTAPNAILFNNSYIYVIKNDNTNLTGWVDGGASISTNAAPYLGSSTSKLGVGNTKYFGGEESEIIVYGRDLTTAEMNQVGNYLGSKYGITWTDIP